MSEYRIPIPEDSIINLWITRFENTEIWHSWKVATALASIGAVLGRDACFHYGEVTPIWPNTSIILIGESGDGKDTIIAPAEEVLLACGIQHVAGKTIEAVKTSLFNIGKTGKNAIGFISAKELSEFLGSKDYQAGLIQSLTDLLSNNKMVDITTKSDLAFGQPKYIHNPTLTMFGGSTVDWFQTSLPVDTMKGGFLPRFIIMTEFDKVAARMKLIPNPGQYDSLEQRDRVLAARVAYLDQMKALRRWAVARSPLHFAENLEGMQYFTNWYANRFSYFPRSMKAYANRSGNLMRKVAMLMAASRWHAWIDEVDYAFASEFIRYGAGRLEDTILSTSREVVVAKDIHAMLPATQEAIIRRLTKVHSMHWVRKGVEFLVSSGQVVTRKGVLEEVKGENESTYSQAAER